MCPQIPQDSYNVNSEKLKKIKKGKAFQIAKYAFETAKNRASIFNKLKGNSSVSFTLTSNSLTDEQIYELFDKDGNGDLTADELKQGIRDIINDNEQTINSDRYQGSEAENTYNNEGTNQDAFNFFANNIDYNWTGRRGDNQLETRKEDVAKGKTDGARSARRMLDSLKNKGKGAGTKLDEIIDNDETLKETPKPPTPTEHPTPTTNTEPPSPTKQPTPTTPTIPTTHTEPTVPTIPTTHTEPTWPTLPTIPTTHTEPTVPTIPTTHTEPTWPTLPTIPTTHTEPTVPTIPTSHTEPTWPTLPTIPTTHTEPTVPTIPTSHTEPTWPTLPTIPTTHTTPTTPTGPTPPTPISQLPEPKVIDVQDVKKDNPFGINEPGSNADGHIGDSKQRSRGDCYFLATINAIRNTKKGQKFLKQNCKINPDGSYTITLPGALRIRNRYKASSTYCKVTGVYRITPEALRRAGGSEYYAGGDLDVVAFELAMEAYRKEMYETARANGDLGNSVETAEGAVSQISPNDSLNGGWSHDAGFILTGEQSARWRGSSNKVYTEGEYGFITREEMARRTGADISVYKNPHLLASYQRTIEISEHVDDLDKMLEQYKGKESEYALTFSVQTAYGGHHALTVLKITDSTVYVVNPWDSQKVEPIPRSEFKKMCLSLTSMPVK